MRSCDREFTKDTGTWDYEFPDLIWTSSFCLPFHCVCVCVCVSCNLSHNCFPSRCKPWDSRSTSSAVEYAWNQRPTMVQDYRKSWKVFARSMQWRTHCCLHGSFLYSILAELRSAHTKLKVGKKVTSKNLNFHSFSGRQGPAPGSVRMDGLLHSKPYTQGFSVALPPRPYGYDRRCLALQPTQPPVLWPNSSSFPSHLHQPQRWNE